MDDKWTVAVREDELLVELPGKVIITYSEDGFGYAVRDGDHYRPGVSSKWPKAYADIRKALDKSQ